MTDALKAALDRFDVPPLSAGLADRILTAAATPTPAPFVPSRRDRRGVWRRGRQVVLGTLAVGLLSAGAVASGFLGSVGIEVPVLTAMLAPKPKPVVKPVRLAPKPPVTRTALEAPPETVVDSAAAGVARPLLPAERIALRQERRERRQAFAAEHPVAAAVIRERVRERLQQRALARRAALPGVRPLDLADRATLVRAARRDRILAERLIDRRLQVREARMAEQQPAENRAPGVGPSVPPATPVESRPLATGDGIQRPLADGLSPRMQPVTPEERAARRARFQQMSPTERTRLRERIQQRRLLREGRVRSNPAQN